MFSYETDQEENERKRNPDSKEDAPVNYVVSCDVMLSYNTGLQFELLVL